MQRAAGVWWVPFGIGLGYGLAAGLVGVAQWVLTQRDLVERLAAFHALQRRYPRFFDETNVVRGNAWFWLVTALVAAVAMLAVCWLAAFTATWVRQRVRDGVMAALVVAAVSGAMYLAATHLVVGDAGRTSVIWPIHPPYLRALLSGGEAKSASSGQLAAVAQERAGPRLSVEQQPDKG
jgi:ABC-type glycerol-3-phosphate transport system permease component